MYLSFKLENLKVALCKIKKDLEHINEYSKNHLLHINPHKSKAKQGN